MARLATALALLATAAATTFDYTVEVSTPNDFKYALPPIDIDPTADENFRNQEASLAVSHDGLLYASSWWTGEIEVFTVDGEHVRTIDPPSDYDLWPSYGIVLNEDGTRLYYTSYYCVRVIELDNDDVSHTLAGDCTGDTDYRDGKGEMAGIEDMEDIQPIAIDEADMNLYIINNQCNVRRIHIETAEVTTIAFGVPGVDFALYQCDEINPDGPDLDLLPDGPDYNIIDSDMGSAARSSFSLYSIAVHGDYIYVTDYETIRRIDVEFPHSVTTIAGDINLNYEIDDEDGANAGGRGLDARFGSYLGLIVDDFGEWMLVTDYDWGVLYQCAIDNVVQCAVIAGEWDDYEEIDGVGTNARFDSIKGIVQGNGPTHDYVFIFDDYTGSIRKLAFDDLRSIENDSPKFTIGVFVAGGVAALLAGFVVLNAAPVA